jgi:hypothetical protein
VSTRLKQTILIALLVALYAFHVQFKLNKIFAHPTWDPNDDVGQFWSEAAFHYGVAKFFAENSAREWSKLAHDRTVQYPDTVNDWAEFTIAMEIPVGVLYRALSPPIHFHVFVVWYAALVGSLTIFAVFWLGQTLWKNAGAGVASAIFYATMYPSYGRTVKNLFLREDFAAPLIVLALGFMIRALENCRAGMPAGLPANGAKSSHSLGHSRPTDFIMAAVFWILALASWHLTQFVLAVAVAALAVYFIAPRHELSGLPRNFLLFVAILTIAGVAVPVLRAKMFVFSLPMCALFGLLAANFVSGRARRVVIFAGVAAVFVAAASLLQKSFSEYAHVYALFWEKLKFFGQKPDDPSQLSFEARMLWEGAFETASMRDFWRSLHFALPLGALGAWFAWRKGARGLRIFVIFALILLPLAWLVLRFFTFFSFATAVLAGGLMAQRRFWRHLAVVGAAAQFAFLPRGPMAREQPAPDEYKPIVRWILENTAPDAPILATISESPVVWAHTKRPMMLHSKFENWQVRQRYGELLRKIYASEDEFYAFAKLRGARFFVFDTGFLYAAKDSRRYKAEKMGELEPNCAAVLFARAPERLRHFRLRAASGRFAVFEVL